MVRLYVLLFAFLCLCVAAKKPIIILQLSDLHFSTNKHGKYFNHFGDRQKDLHTFSTDILPALSPSSILITGDLTDAKTPQGAGLQQELEWIAYREAIDYIVQSTDIPESRIFDVKGNHDAFNLPLRGGDWDYWPSYAVEGRRSGPTKRVFVNQIYPPSFSSNSNDEGEEGEEEEEEEEGGPPPCPSVTLLGIDASAQVGLKSPANFCGHITPDMLRDIDHELTKQDAKRPTYCSKPPLIVYSHFPISTLDHRPGDLNNNNNNDGSSYTSNYQSTTTSTSSSDDVYARYSRGGLVGAIRHLTHKITPMQGLGELLTAHQATVYVSGHLHTVFGERLHTVHTHKDGHGRNNMAELETAAWKDDRRFRIMSIDTDDDDDDNDDTSTTSGRQSGFTFMDLYFHTPLSPRQEKRGDGEATKDALWRSRYKLRGWAVTSTDSSARVIDHIPMITWPPDGRYQVVEKKRSVGEVGRGRVNAMVFPLVGKEKEKMMKMTMKNATSTSDDTDEDVLLSIDKVILVTRLSSGVKLLEHDMQSVDGGMHYTAAPEITIYCPKGANNNSGGGGGGSSYYHVSGRNSGEEDERACSDGVKHVEIQLIVKYTNTDSGGRHKKGVMVMESRSIVQPALLKCTSNWNGEGKRAVSERCRITPATELLPLGTSIIENIFLHLNAPVFTQQVIVIVWLIQVVLLLLLPRMFMVKYVPQLLTAPLFAPTELKQHGIAAGYFRIMTVRAWRTCLGALLWPFVALCITASVTEVWLPWFMYSIYLIAGPWLMADLLSGKPPALMFWYGVAGKFSDGVNVGLGQAAALNWQYIATPDTMLLSLAHFIGCVVPVTLWIACVVARRVQLSTSPSAAIAASSAGGGNSMTSPGRNTANISSAGKNQGGGSLLAQEGPKYKLFSTLQLLFFVAMLVGNVGVIYIKAAHLMGPLCLIVSPGLTGTMVLAVVLVRWKKFGAIAKKGKAVLTSSAGGGKR